MFPLKNLACHDDVIKWKHFPRYWPFVRGIHRSPVNFPHKGQWRGALMFSLICVWINGWVNNREAGDLRCHCAHYDVTVMWRVELNMLTQFIVQRMCRRNGHCAFLAWLVSPITPDNTLSSTCQFAFQLMPFGGPTKRDVWDQMGLLARYQRLCALWHIICHVQVINWPVGYDIFTWLEV